MFLFPRPQMRPPLAPVVGGADSGPVAAAAPPPVVASAAGNRRRRRRRRERRGEGKEVRGGEGGEEGVGYRWRRRAGSDAGSGPVAAAAAAPVVAAVAGGIGGGSSVDNIYIATKRSSWHPLSWISGSSCCSLSTRYWVRYFSVTFLNQTDLSYFILVG